MAGLTGVARALIQLEAENEWTLQQQISICEIPAPPFREQRRAEEFARRLRDLGLANVRIDGEGNVIGERSGAAAAPLVVLGAHLDTVFPEGTDVSVRRSADTLRGPGIADDCRGLAVLLAVARVLRDSNVPVAGTILFVGTVGEEGEGNLRGVRHLFDAELAGRIDYFVAVDGAGLDITSRAVGSNRYRIRYYGPGGHSYGAFGMPNPIHALGRVMARIAGIQVPSRPKTTFNVGVISGGTSVNSISESATMSLDLRSESPAALAALDSAARAAVMAALADERARWTSRTPLDVQIDTIGIRPAGTQPDTALIVRTARDIGVSLGFTPRREAGSTDANVPMSRGIPAITIDGGGSASGTHSLSEMYVDGPRGWLGPQWAMLIVLQLAGAR
jgi:tripeptide aminopeptidase